MFGLVAKDKQESNSATANTVTTNIVTSGVANLEIINYGLPGGRRVVSELMYAPSDFKNFQVQQHPGNESLLYFNVAPGLPNSVKENDANRFVLPENSQVIGALLTNNGTPIITTVNDIAYELFPVEYSTAFPVSGRLSAIVKDISMGNLNSRGGISVGFNQAGFSNLAPLGSLGANVPTLTVITQPTKALSIGIYLTSDAIGEQPTIKSGDLALILTYILDASLIFDRGSIGIKKKFFGKTIQ